MDSLVNCGNSTLDIVNKLAELLSRNERGQLLLAAVPKLRIQLFESILLSSKACSTQLEQPPCHVLLSQLLENEPDLLLNKSFVLQCKEISPLLAALLERAITHALFNKVENDKLATFGVQDSTVISLPVPALFKLSPMSEDCKPAQRSSQILKLHHLPTELQTPVYEKESTLPNQISVLQKHGYRVEPKLTTTFLSSAKRIWEPRKPMLFKLPRIKEKVCVNNTALQDESCNECSFLEPPKQFCSDLNISHELKALCAQSHGKTFEASILSQIALIQDLKKTATGIQSEIFPCTINGVFSYQTDITVENVLPDVLTDFLQPFLYCGACYQRLNARTKWNKDAVRAGRIEHPLNRTMRYLVTEFLTTYRQFMISQCTTQLTQLFYNTRSAMQLLVAVDNMFISEPRFDINNDTSGAHLLRYLWSELGSCISSDFSELLLYFLKRLCETYYCQLQKWIYHGTLEEPFNELFIKRIGMYDECTKEFFDKAVVVNDETVPGFLVGCEQAILQCGKYNKLLKTFKRKHEIFEYKYPDIYVCLSHEQLSDMQNNVEQYYSSIMQYFEPCRMQDIYAERAAYKSRFVNQMLQRTQAHIEAWEQKQSVLLQAANKQKKILYAQLNAQREEDISRKLQQRRNEIVSEYEYQNQCQQLEEMRLQRNINELQANIGRLEAENVPIVEKSSPDGSSGSQSYVSCYEEFPTEVNPESASDGLTLGVQFKRSISDVLNSNEQVSTTTANSSQEEETRVQRQINTDSEAKRNRLLVLNCTDETQLALDVNLNSLETKPEKKSDLQRNRTRMMQHDTFAAFNDPEDENTRRVRCKIDGETECARNRRRILKGEFDIMVVEQKNLNLTLEQNKLNVGEAALVGTPMSTTSDIEISQAADVQDATNNNTSSEEGISENSSKGYTQSWEEKVESEIDTNEAKVMDDVASTENKWQPQHLQILTPLPTVIDKPKMYAQSRPTHNTDLIQRYLQLSIMLPLKAHFSLLRNEVLRIFLKDVRVYDHFNHLRNYFFLLNGEFGTQLTSRILCHIEDGIEPRSLCQKDFLDSILATALNVNTTDDTKYMLENLTLTYKDMPEKFDLMSLDALSFLELNYKVNWPLNLVISAETLNKYSLVFSYLLKLRHIAFMLDRSYEYLRQVGKRHSSKLRVSPQYRHLQMTRCKLSHFVITLQTHLATNALQASWKTFKEDLCNASTVEELYQQHVAYLKRISFLALLNRRSAKFQETIDGIFVIVLRFCQILQSQDFTVDAEQLVHPRYKRLVYEEGEFEKFMRYIIYLGNKVAISGYQEEIADLIRLINFNNYYQVSVENLA